MSIAAFVGPSLPVADRERFGGVAWLPPAEAGDLLRLDRDIETICLIDGYFDHRPAVRHKEILWLLARGVRVYGASSIGALRAAEMDPFGMIGVGAIYRAYARGTITGDDEVALVHGPEAWDMRALSVPLVDVRATLVKARRARVVDRGAARAILTAARAIHYIDRTWADIAAAAPAAFAAWLETGAVDQKRIDAAACMRAAISGAGGETARPAFVRTAFIEELARECGVEL